MTLKQGAYELYCPVGGDSHKKLGMLAHLRVGGSGAGEEVTGGGPVESCPVTFPLLTAPPR